MDTDGLSARELAATYNLLVTEERSFGHAGVREMVGGMPDACVRALLGLLVAREAASC